MTVVADVALNYGMVYQPCVTLNLITLVALTMNIVEVLLSTAMPHTALTTEKVS